MVKHLTAADFEAAINASRPVLVDFWATWCGPCRMLAPTIELLAEEMEGIAKVGKVNVDEQPGLAARFGISSIPTLIVFEDGKVKNTSVGVIPKSMIEDMLR